MAKVFLTVWRPCISIENGRQLLKIKIPHERHTKNPVQYLNGYLFHVCISPADYLMCKYFYSFLVLDVRFCQDTTHACVYLTRLIFVSIFYHDNPYVCGISTAEKLCVIFGQVYCFHYDTSVATK